MCIQSMYAADKACVATPAREIYIAIASPTPILYAQSQASDQPQVVGIDVL
jgi:hypothetical protein